MTDTDTEHSNSRNTQVEKPQQDGKSERVQTSNSGLDVSSVAQQLQELSTGKYNDAEEGYLFMKIIQQVKELEDELEYYRSLHEFKLVE